MPKHKKRERFMLQVPESMHFLLLDYTWEKNKCITFKHCIVTKKTPKTGPVFLGDGKQNR